VADASFENSVFINCPFDPDFAPILQAMLFCTVYLGFKPRIARERSNSAENRIDKITDLIQQSKYSIHDLSRSQAKVKGEYSRMNMPFELGIDYASRAFHDDHRSAKRLLILDEKQYRYQAALSDISGCDIEIHRGDYQIAMRKVRNWLVTEAAIIAEPANRIHGHYADFQGWYYNRRLADGWSEDDIKDYPTTELLGAMETWIATGKPVTL
jgi:hypothetical protein